MKNFRHFLIDRTSGLKCLFLITVLTAVMGATQAQVGVGTTTPHASAQLEVDSDQKGFLMPRMTEDQRTDIDNPAPGLLVYQTDEKTGFYYYNGSEWKLLLSDARIGFTATAGSQTVSTSTLISGFSLLNDDGGGFDPSNGTYTVPETGVYRVSAVVNYSTVASVAISLGPSVNPKVALGVDGVETFTGLFPILDVNTLILTFRTVLGSGSVVISGDIPLTAGQIVDLRYVAGGMTLNLNLGSVEPNGIVWSMQKL